MTGLSCRISPPSNQGQPNLLILTATAPILSGGFQVGKRRPPYHYDCLDRRDGVGHLVKQIVRLNCLVAISSHVQIAALNG